MIGTWDRQRGARAASLRSRTALADDRLSRMKFADQRDRPMRQGDDGEARFDETGPRLFVLEALHESWRPDACCRRDSEEAGLATIVVAAVYARSRRQGRNRAAVDRIEFTVHVEILRCFTRHRSQCRDRRT